MDEKGGGWGDKIFVSLALGKENVDCKGFEVPCSFVVGVAVSVAAVGKLGKGAVRGLEDLVCFGTAGSVGWGFRANNDGVSPVDVVEAGKTGGLNISSFGFRGTVSGLLPLDS